MLPARFSIRENLRGGERSFSASPERGDPASPPGIMSRNSAPTRMHLRALLHRCEAFASSLSSPLLLLLRLWWGLSFARTGWGKLRHLEEKELEVKEIV